MGIKITNPNYIGILELNQVSPCCHAEIEQGTVREYPLGGSTWYQSFKVDICSKCGQEVDEPVEECGICGEIGCRNSCTAHASLG